MLRMPPPQTFPPETLSLDDLVPQNHLVRKVDAALDFEFIRNLVAPLYCHNNAINLFENNGVCQRFGL
ncbi:hypothetical protein XNC1_p0076 (plasmid) [Xenorhabdus nematophila ATCC 19061]|uniref:Transposase InsH N-terminal domain-containing protein n=1 Tax=Xenorhabdus nematophila (strain ATCC 19061 / DSM 3370 / CCUG 14189 / LMG 1036 / NCIMB 9965 / AN6) TaxID=406817 RepID=D3VLZ2_XENNA|nr:hypothetical protein XNC1_p0076 [Xenorhabdus nematophila ATCC 19061]CEK25559.1 conserved protein of unknown function [Xenorhabdus nematophila AN6/1]